MSDNKNMELNDEMMAKVTGGVVGAQTEPKFKVGDHVHYERAFPQTGQTMALNGTITAMEFINEISMWRYTIKTDPNEFNCPEVQAREDSLTYI